MTFLDFNLQSLFRCVPGVGLYFCCLHTMTSNLCKNNAKPSSMEAMTFGFSARVIAGSILLPFTLIKTRYESGMFGYTSVPAALRSTYIKEGTRGLFTGLVPTLMRDAPFSGIYYMFYSQLKNGFTSDLPSNTRTYYNFICGLMAGIAASIITQPADVIKTKMQLHPKDYPNLNSAIMSILRRKGPAGFLFGLTPRLIRRSLMATLAWTVFDSFNQLFTKVS